MRNNISKLKLIFFFAWLNSFSSWLLILFYTSGLNFIWLVNVVFILNTLLIGMAVSPRQLLASPISIFFLILVFISGLKIPLLWLNSIEFRWGDLMSYTFGLLMPLICLAFCSDFNKQNRKQVLYLYDQFAVSYAKVAVSGILVYAILYFSGYIVYFGLGMNVHYFAPYFLLNKGIGFSAGILIVVFLSGKRASLITFISQVVVQNLGQFRKHPAITIFAFSFVIFMFYFVLTSTDLLVRFTRIFEYGIDFTDPYFLIITFGGRFEEVLGVVKYFQEFPLHLLFGSPPGAGYSLVIEFSDYFDHRNYAHFTPVGFLFKYGLFGVVGIYGFLFWVIFCRWNPADPLYLIVVGVFLSSFFGASLSVDPFIWIIIGLTMKFNVGGRKSGSRV